MAVDRLVAEERLVAVKLTRGEGDPLFPSPLLPVYVTISPARRIGPCIM